MVLRVGAETLVEAWSSAPCGGRARTGLVSTSSLTRCAGSVTRGYVRGPCGPLVRVFSGRGGINGRGGGSGWRRGRRPHVGALRGRASSPRVPSPAARVRSLVATSVGPAGPWCGCSEVPERPMSLVAGETNPQPVFVGSAGARERRCPTTGSTQRPSPWLSLMVTLVVSSDRVFDRLTAGPEDPRAASRAACRRGRRPCP